MYSYSVFQTVFGATDTGISSVKTLFAKVQLELKKGFGKYMSHQATYYWTYIEDNFEKVYLDARSKCKELPEDYKQINRNEVEIVLVAKEFHSYHISLAQKAKEEHIKLIKYNWFENDILLFDYVHNAPDITQVPTGNTDGTEIENALMTMTWNEVVNTFVRQAYRAKYLAISPDTEEHIDKLRLLANRIPIESRRTAVLNWLNQREKQLEQE